MRLVLASASPARLAVLRAAGVEPDVMVSGVDESAVESTDPREVCATLARMKAEAVVARLRHAVDPSEWTLVLGCDSVLELDGEIHGKPTSSEEAVARWRRMRGRTGILHTGHCLIDVLHDRRAEEAGTTEVKFASISDGELNAYIDAGEPLQVAGAFAVNGLGGWFVEQVVGDIGNVVGVSLPALRRLLARLGIAIPALWNVTLATARRADQNASNVPVSP